MPRARGYVLTAYFHPRPTPQSTTCGSACTPGPLERWGELGAGGSGEREEERKVMAVPLPPHSTQHAAGIQAQDGQYPPQL